MPSISDILPVVFALLPVAAPFLAALYKLLVSKLPANQFGHLQSVVTSSVLAAEQLYNAVPGSGQAKRAWVLAHIEAIVGNKVNAALIEQLIEASVAALPSSQMKLINPAAQEAVPYSAI